MPAHRPPVNSRRGGKWRSARVDGPVVPPLTLCTSQHVLYESGMNTVLLTAPPLGEPLQITRAPSLRTTIIHVLYLRAAESHVQQFPSRHQQQVTVGGELIAGSTERGRGFSRVALPDGISWLGTVRSPDRTRATGLSLVWHQNRSKNISTCALNVITALNSIIYSSVN